MGQAVQALVDGHYRIAARINHDKPDYAALSCCDIVIDFSTPDALMTALPHLPAGVALVSGTTGLSAEQEAIVTDYGSKHPILRSGNFSVGINVLVKLARQAAQVLGEGWDIEILEMHHRHKVDAPSGTALMLAAAAAKGRGVDLDTVLTLDRDGLRRDGDIGFSVLRGGGVFGDHEVRLVSESQMITLGHRALNRDVFAEGALTAADWLIGQAPGLYAMSDMLEADDG